MSRPGLAPTPLLRGYRVATSALVPLAWWLVSRKLKAQGVSTARRHERLGNASLPRPLRRVIWFHAASVGESLSVLTLITRMGARLPQFDFLITSGTATSAELIAARLPARCVHQFAPLDATGPVRRFLDHWKPAAAIFVESELWPLMLTESHAAGVPLALLNARLSDRSVAGWLKRPDTARFVMDRFAVILTQNSQGAQNLLAMGADPARLHSGINLKSTSAPLPIDAVSLAELQRALGGRPLWAASSTHPGEEAKVLAAHKTLLARHSDLCLLLIPRHPDRGDEVAQIVADSGLSCARRSSGQPVQPGTQVYLADTLGETGTWYAAAPIVFLGGSLVPVGGHNPFEPAQSGAAILTGPHVTNFSESFAPLIQSGGARSVADAPALAEALGDWLGAPDRLADVRAAARGFAATQGADLDGIIDTLAGALGLGLHG